MNARDLDRINRLNPRLLRIFHTEIGFPIFENHMAGRLPLLASEKNVIVKKYFEILPKNFYFFQNNSKLKSDTGFGFPVVGNHMAGPIPPAPLG